MQYVIIAIVLVFLSIIGIGISKSFSQTSSKSLVSSELVTDSSRSELDKMLSEIEKKAEPQEKMGAMCYDSALPPQYQEYVCSIDGEKTVYDSDITVSYQIVRNLVEMRRLVNRINSLTKSVVLSLDERRMCHKCFPNLKDAGRYVSLVVTYPDNRKHVHTPVTLWDLQVLVGFFEKKLSYKTENDREIPLKRELKRIRGILGMAE